ncbi:hypothetical protein E1A91_A10G238400v1 [Gossypium mustelinum]|uniref:Secreted protein n=1 Tax=Gossypium mustelinum TaxID=34275 RepID=A0A5D2XQD1_GOSMU|nr:hypothetical protein E1A91_A10G238400v1 [Gossypium mustelinum]
MQSLFFFFFFFSLFFFFFGFKNQTIKTCNMMQKLSAKHFYKNRIRQSQKNVKDKFTYLQCHVMQRTLEMSIKNKDIQGEITPCYRNPSMLKRSYFVVHIAIAATNSYELKLGWFFFLLPRMAFKK